MSWNGYFRYGDTEIINSTRAAAYADALGLTWVKNTYPDGQPAPSLPALLGDAPYVHPAVDVAPWYDPDIPESANFGGLVPINVSGLDDSTRESSVFEYTTDGGNPGSLREATKPVVFSVALIGVDDAAVDYGFRWLKRALKRRECAPGSTVSCRGEDMFFSSRAPVEWVDPGVTIYDGGSAELSGPDLIDGGDPGDEIDMIADGGAPYLAPPADLSAIWDRKYERHLRRVLFNRGPIVNNTQTMPGCNGVVWLVSFTATAGDPFQYGAVEPVLRDMISTVSAAGDPYVDGLSGDTGTFADLPETECPTQINTPIFDPLCSPFAPPPQPPDLMPGCFDLPATWDRLYAEIPAGLVPLWDEVRPVITLTADEEDVRMVRIRFYNESSDPDDACGWVGEYIVSFLPAGFSVAIDTSQQAVLAWDSSGVVRRSDSLVFGSNAKPVTWFGLSCGSAYRMTVDTDGDAALFDVDLDLVPRSA